MPELQRMNVNSLPSAETVGAKSLLVPPPAAGNVIWTAPSVWLPGEPDTVGGYVTW